MFDRRSFLSYFSTLGLSSTLLPGILWAKVKSAGPDAEAKITKGMLREACAVAGITFTDEQLDAMLQGVDIFRPCCRCRT